MKTKSIITSLILLIAAVISQAAEPWESEYGRLLGKYVTTAGTVKYKEWKANAADVAALQKITDQIAASGPSDSSRDGRFAYHINAYNAWMLRLVLDSYPIKSVRDIAPLFGVFTAPRITVAGKKISLNHLEKEILIPEFKDPRVHFAINCASTSCPPLLNAAYTAPKLNAQLDAQAKAFANKGDGAVLVTGNKAKLSKIFDWYAADFKASGGASAFLSKNRTEPIPADAKLSYFDYDWNLNEAR
ncbi:MAG: DUF547 domain-containing protein [Chthoniobacteraceae bacterium]